MGSTPVVVALPTDDGRTLITRHFGDAAAYEVFEHLEGRWYRLEHVVNDVTRHHGHGTSGKARGIAGILRVRGVTVAAAPVFGENLARIQRRLACVLVPPGAIEDTLGLLGEHRENLQQAHSAGAARDVLDLR